MRAEGFTELEKLAGALLAGMAAGLVYDMLRIVRLPFRGNAVINGALDLVFCAALGVISAVALLYLNDGALRLYLIAGIAAGVFLYMRTVGFFAAKLFLGRDNGHKSCDKRK